MSSWKEYGYKNTTDIYKDIHTKMKNQYVNNANVQQEIDNAKALEAFLFKVKNIDKDVKHPITALININYLDLVQKATQTMPNAKSINNLFRRAHNRNQKLLDGADDIFEQELSAVIKTFENMSLISPSSKINNHTTLLTGQSSANIVNSIVETTLKESQKVIIAQANKTKNNELYSGPVFRAGKIDIQGAYADINIETEVKDDLQFFAKLLKDATISAKNYSSQYWSKDEQKKIDKNVISLHLGSTDVFKAFVGGMSSLGFPTSVIIKAFFAGYVNYTKYNNKDIGYHIYHMRFLYELRGTGLYDKEGNNLKEVKYLIWNDPSSDDIKVFSTAGIIRSLLLGEITSGENPFGGIYLRYSH